MSGDPGGRAVVVYSRPGCPFCSRLRSGLRRAGVDFTEVNIWNVPDAAAFVRSVADGNETVPTVTVGTVSLVNPPVKQVIGLLPADAAGDHPIRRQPGRLDLLRHRSERRDSR